MHGALRLIITPDIPVGALRSPHLSWAEIAAFTTPVASLDTSESHRHTWALTTGSHVRLTSYARACQAVTPFLRHVWISCRETDHLPERFIAVERVLRASGRWYRMGEFSLYSPWGDFELDVPRLLDIGPLREEIAASCRTLRRECDRGDYGKLTPTLTHMLTSRLARQFIAHNPSINPQKISQLIESLVMSDPIKPHASLV